MTLKIEETLHGAVILEILTAISKKKKDYSYKLFNGRSSSSYYLHFYNSSKKSTLNFFNKESKPDKKIGIFIKISRKRISPWRYTFKREHQEEVEEMKLSADDTYVALVSGMDGIALLTYSNLKKLLDYNYEETEWLSVSRKFNEYYRVDGNDGKKKLNIPKSNFPSKILKKLF